MWRSHYRLHVFCFEQYTGPMNTIRYGRRFISTMKVGVHDSIIL